MWRESITSAYEPDVFAVVRKVLSDIGYSSEGIAMDTFVHQQSPDIAGAVDTSKERREGVSDNQIDWFQGAGDQGVMIGYACDETKQLMPIPVVLANRIVRELSACRQSSYIQGILPDGKAQVTVEYEKRKACSTGQCGSVLSAYGGQESEETGSRDPKKGASSGTSSPSAR